MKKWNLILLVFRTFLSVAGASYAVLWFAVPGSFFPNLIYFALLEPFVFLLNFGLMLHKPNLANVLVTFLSAIALVINICVAPIFFPS